jgi:hypothetical protein
MNPREHQALLIKLGLDTSQGIPAGSMEEQLLGYGKPLLAIGGGAAGGAILGGLGDKLLGTALNRQDLPPILTMLGMAGGGYGGYQAAQPTDGQSSFWDKIRRKTNDASQSVFGSNWTEPQGTGGVGAGAFRDTTSKDAAFLGDNVPSITPRPQPPMPNKVAAAQPSLGDPDYWAGGQAEIIKQQLASQGGTPMPEAPMPEASAPGGAEGGGSTGVEQVAAQLPPGSFQGLNIRVTPEGKRSTGLKVTPDALASPEVLQQVFQTEPEARIEITSPETSASVTSFSERG